MRSPAAACRPSLPRELYVTTTHCDPEMWITIFRTGTFHVHSQVVVELENANVFHLDNVQSCGNQPANSESRSLIGFKNSRHDGSVSSNMILSALVMKYCTKSTGVGTFQDIKTEVTNVKQAQSAVMLGSGDAMDQRNECTRSWRRGGRDGMQRNGKHR